MCKAKNLFEDEFSLNSWFQSALKTLKINDSKFWIDEFGDKLYNSMKLQENKIRTLSLFSGAGGLDIGFHDAGFEIVECNELEMDFSKTLITNSQKGERLYGSSIVCQDIREYDPDLENIDFIIGGPPCQTFSAAGARAAGVNGIDDDRGNLFQEYVRILKKLKPKGFLFENVYRIIGAQNGKPWQLIQEAFHDAGYKLYWKILDAADYGVPQHRERLFIIGLREGEFLFPFPSHGPDSIDSRPYFSARQAISGIKENIEAKELNGRHGHLLKDIPPGLNYSFYTERMGHPTPYFGWRSKFSDYLYKADPEVPVRTLKAQGGQYTGPFHWENRVFSIAELKRLQTFPDNYKVIGNRAKAIHQLGNSVPPQLARILALAISDQVFQRQLPFKMQYMPKNYKLGFRARKRMLTNIYQEKAKQAINKIKDDFPRKNYLIEANNYIKLHENFMISQVEEDDIWDFYIEHVVEEESIKIKIKDSVCRLTCNSEKKYYEYKILIPSKHKITTIYIESFSQEYYSVTAVWKYLEKLIKEIYHKDDLVQLFGYYQHKRSFRIEFRFQNDIDDNKKALFDVLQRISDGNHIGEIVHLSYLSKEYGLSENKLFSVLKMLKKVGFEIRNSNTNMQIKKDHVLIPYMFPTLNQRSLQRLKEL